MLEETLLPEKPELKRAVIYRPEYGGVVFGTLATISREQALASEFSRNQRDETNWPEIMAGYRRSTEIRLPQGWRRGHCWFSDFHGVATFAGSWLEEQGRFHWPEGVPLEVGLLLSSMMQLGEKATFRNFKRYLDVSRLKFLPFVIRPSGYRFYVFNPTPERIYQATNTFSAVLEELRSLEPGLAPLIRVVYALIRLDEVKVSFESVQKARTRLEEAHASIISGLSRNLSLVYENLRGPKDVTLFDLEMYGKGN